MSNSNDILIPVVILGGLYIFRNQIMSFLSQGFTGLSGSLASSFQGLNNAIAGVQTIPQPGVSSFTLNDASIRPLVGQDLSQFNLPVTATPVQVINANGTSSIQTIPGISGATQVFLNSSGQITRVVQGQ